MTKTIPLAEAKKNLSAIIDAVENRYDRFTVTKKGISRAVILSVEEYEGLMETLDILSNKEERDALRQAKKEVKNRDTLSLSKAKNRYGLK
ncbi:MAG: type II toxin-antitoxin system Phd/YefM family antitoxin [Syntrophorhabdaceae bacterium]|nr:type II toxin-antitoxin system Phd/YefM family antitoxin [Syntrophorhabdaceae bacterium]